MKVAVNTRFLIKDQLEGIGRFTYETLACMVKDHPEDEFYFLFDRPFDQTFAMAPNVKCISLSPPARHPFLFIWYFEISIYNALKNIQPDVFLSCDGFLSLRTSIPQVPVIHDLAFEHYPEDVSWIVRKYYKYFFPRFARKAKHIATVSEASKLDIIKTYGIDPNKISVVYNGASEIFKPVDAEEKRNIKVRYTGSCNYFVYVGALQPRKNIHRLLAAFDIFKRSDAHNYILLIIGRKAWKTKSIRLAFEKMQYGSDVLFTGRISDTELSKVLAAATALTYIPYFEGFGIPILEAMQCETPVITSNISAMPEVAGDAGILVNPFDVNNIASAMEVISSDKLRHQQLSANALQHAKKFSWQKTSDALWDVIQAAGRSDV